MKELALEVSTDIDQKFELALSLDDLQKALTIIEESTKTKKGGAAEPKWRSLGDRALALWNVELAAKCFRNAGDLPALLLIYSSLGDRDGMRGLAEAASEF
jgi:coatomer subunit beta'